MPGFVIVCRESYFVSFLGFFSAAIPCTGSFNCAIPATVAKNKVISNTILSSYFILTDVIFCCCVQQRIDVKVSGHNKSLIYILLFAKKPKNSN